VLQGIVHCLRLRLAFVRFELGLQLFPGPFQVLQKFLACPESKTADVAICNTGDIADEPYDLKISLRHEDIMAGRKA
jgi:hypothetical protein